MDFLAISSSGLNAAASMLNAAAGNIANSDTAGYRARQVNLVSGADGGVAVGSITSDPSDGGVDADGDDTSNTDLISESVSMRIARELYDANAVAFRVGEKVTGTLLDILDTDGDSK
jgi:flagellar basal body rod protein FlgC